MSEELLKKLEIFFSQYQPYSYKKKDIVLQIDEVSGNVFFIKKGYVRAFRISEEGEELTLTILKPYDFFPMSYGINNIPSNCYLEALTPLEVWKVPQEKFSEYLRHQPEIFYDLANHILVRFGGLLARMEYLITGRAYTKIATTILVCAKRFGEQYGNDIIVNLPLTHKDIATLVGITRETTCLEMKKLEKKGLISHQGRYLVIKDIERLGTESLLGNEAEWLVKNSL